MYFLKQHLIIKEQLSCIPGHPGLNVTCVGVCPFGEIKDASIVLFGEKFLGVDLLLSFFLRQVAKDRFDCRTCPGKFYKNGVVLRLLAVK